MAHMWIFEADAWRCEPLRDAAALGAGAELLRATTPDGERWAILGGREIRVNGTPVDAGIVVLRDRDEISAAGRRVFFSTESLATVVPFVAGERPTFCPRCRGPIEDGSPAVLCPNCRVWYHQSAELPCWRYAERCALCDQPTALDAGWRWTPEAL